MLLHVMFSVYWFSFQFKFKFTRLHFLEVHTCITKKLKNMETSIAESFRDGTVFVTGSTGFLGKILTEKLLRSCSIKKIALLVRSKKGIDSSQRVADIYNESVS